MKNGAGKRLEADHGSLKAPPHDPEAVASLPRSGRGDYAKTLLRREFGK
jgi:hypothetical protein